MGKIIGWGLAGVAAIIAVVYVATKKDEASPDFCIANLPEPFRSDVKKVVDAGDVERMESFAAQSDAKGWHCAAKELRKLAKETVPEPWRTQWNALIARSKSESSGDFVVELQKAAIEAQDKGFSNTEKQLRAALKLVVERVDFKDIREEPLATDIANALRVGDDRALDDIAHRLEIGGYGKAARQAKDEAESIRKKRAAYASSCEGIINTLPASPLKFTKSSLKDSVGNVRAWVLDVYRTGGEAAKNFVSLVLEDEAASMMGAESAEVGPGPYYEAAKCLREERT